MQPSDLIPFIDYTRLVDNDTTENIIEFCKQAQGVAAVCIYPEYITTAKENSNGIRIATVANFPTGKKDISITEQTILNSLALGANEIDIVMPYHLLVENKLDAVSEYLAHCRKLTTAHALKIIIESGALNTQQIQTATKLVIDSNADFVKTSTGKIEQGASLTAATTILEILAKQSNPPGIKLSGGIRTVEQAFEYITLVSDVMGKDWLTPQKLRFGASQLLTTIAKKPSN